MGFAGIDVLEIHSRKSQAQRTKTSDQFRSAKNAILFSSVRFLNPKSNVPAVLLAHNPPSLDTLVSHHHQAYHQNRT